MLDIRLDVDAKGPIFDGRADRAVEAFIDQATQDIGDQAFSYVMRNLDASIRNPTPYYETQIIVERQGNDVVVHDRGIIYGPWLEGVGSRNSPVTRFPGYFSFRRAAQKVRGEADAIAEQTLRRFLPRMQ